ncbi:MAG: type II secretion system F family protein [Myxococcota bacterium]|nr:type II secretion system F family protein [Myxococcota bacterium]
MSTSLVLGISLLALAVGGSLQLHRTWLRSRAARRLGRPEEDAPTKAEDDASSAPVLTESPDLRPGCGAALVATAIAWLFGLAIPYATAAGAIAGVIVHVTVAVRWNGRALAAEETLAESIGLVTAALRAGASPLDALERAAGEAEGAFGRALDGMIARLRLGEEPRKALSGLAEAVPLDSVRLFALALSVQWGAGGSLERTLGVVARSVRDRVELLRRIESQLAPTRGSVTVLVLANAAVAGLAWSNDPVNLGRFLASSTGTLLVASAMWLQALALLWMWRLSRVV